MGAVNNPLQTVLSRVLDAREVAGGWQARCPAHDDTTPSLSITEGKDGRVLLHCHAGCGTDDVVRALSLELRDLFTDRQLPGLSSTPKIVGEYDYTDEHGTLLFQALRYHPKGFKQRRPDGAGGWTWKLDGVRRVLYHLPEVVQAARTGGIVFVVEGEKDVERLRALKIVATTNAGGAGKWRPEYAAALRSAHVYIVPDHDKPGRDHADQVARSLHGTAASVKIVELPGVPAHGDVSDWFDAGHDGRELMELARDAAPWTPPATPAPAVATLPPAQPTGAPTRLYYEDTPSFTDTGNSTRLIALHGARLRHVHAWATWLVWSGTVWAHDPKAALLDELTKDVGLALKREAAACADDSTAKVLFAWGQKSLAAGKIRAAEILARGIPGVLIDHEQLDADGWLLGVGNGVVDLRTGAFRAADPKDLMTMQCPAAYDATATCPRFTQAMAEWFPDAEVRAYVQRVAGAAVVGEQRDHVFVIHYGEGGNGKGTFIRALEAVLGPYATKIHLSLLIEVKHREHDTVRAALFRTRLAVAEETSQVARLNESSVKNLTGGDTIMARRMREDPWRFKPTHSLWLCTNHLPQIQGRDTGIWRRVRVVKWVRTFAGAEMDTTLDAVLAREASGILNWLLAGGRAGQTHGLKEPDAVLRDTLAYRQSQDVLTRFAEDVGLTFDKGLAIGGSRLQELLKAWVEQEGIPRPNNKAVSDWLLSHPGVRVENPRMKGRQLRYWRGVGVPGEDGLLNADTAVTDVNGQLNAENAGK